MVNHFGPDQSVIKTVEELIITMTKFGIVKSGIQSNLMIVIKKRQGYLVWIVQGKKLFELESDSGF